jgi:hypothetical protein
MWARGEQEMGQPSKIMLIRQGEKPEHKSQAPFGVTSDGIEDSESLIVQGWQRAGAQPAAAANDRPARRQAPDRAEHRFQRRSGAGVGDSRSRDRRRRADQLAA